MNKYIKEQLLKCKVAQIPEFSEDTLELKIPRVGPVIIDPLDFTLNGEYNIEVENYILYPYPGFTLHDNWNRGIVPTDKQMHVMITQIMGKMIQVQAVGLHDGKEWTGWLPKKSCRII